MNNKKLNKAVASVFKYVLSCVVKLALVEGLRSTMCKSN